MSFVGLKSVNSWVSKEVYSNRIKFGFISTLYQYVTKEPEKDENESQINDLIINVDRVIQKIASKNEIPYLKKKVFNKDIETQRIIGTLASTLQLKNELLLFNLKRTDSDTLNDVEKTKRFLAERMQEEFVLEESPTEQIAIIS